MSESDESPGAELAMAAALGGAFALLLSPLLWHFDRLALLWAFAKGYALLAAGSLLSLGAWRGLLAVLFKIAGLNADRGTGEGVRLLSVSALCLFFALAWASFAALWARSGAASTPAWGAALLYVAGLVASYLGYASLTIGFRGGLYRGIAFGALVPGYAVFALFPRAALFLFGWLFRALGWSPG